MPGASDPQPLEGLAGREIMGINACGKRAMALSRNGEFAGVIVVLCS